ncbi:MAG: hypothetical protein MAG453_00951 [Calditrichaeota bacterium]|nr:hypothetical protein [Calditrichota bacterium]
MRERERDLRRRVERVRVVLREAERKRLRNLAFADRVGAEPVEHVVHQRDPLVGHHRVLGIRPVERILDVEREVGGFAAIVVLVTDAVDVADVLAEEDVIRPRDRDNPVSPVVAGILAEVQLERLVEEAAGDRIVGLAVEHAVGRLHVVESALDAEHVVRQVTGREGRLFRLAVGVEVVLVGEEHVSAAGRVVVVGRVLPRPRRHGGRPPSDHEHGAPTVAVVVKRELVDALVRSDIPPLVVPGQRLIHLRRVAGAVVDHENVGGRGTQLDHLERELVVLDRVGLALIVRRLDPVGVRVAGGAVDRELGGEDVVPFRVQHLVRHRLFFVLLHHQPGFVGGPAVVIDDFAADRDGLRPVDRVRQLVHRADDRRGALRIGDADAHHDVDDGGRITAPRVVVVSHPRPAEPGVREAAGGDVVRERVRLTAFAGLDEADHEVAAVINPHAAAGQVVAGEHRLPVLACLARVVVRAEHEVAERADRRRAARWRAPIRIHVRRLVAVLPHERLEVAGAEPLCLGEVHRARCERLEVHRHRVAEVARPEVVFGLVVQRPLQDLIELAFSPLRRRLLCRVQILDVCADARECEYKNGCHCED